VQISSKPLNTWQDRQYTYQRNTEDRWRHHSYLAKTIKNTYSECVSVASVIQHALRMRRIIICGMSDPTHITTLSHKRHDFWKNVIEHEMHILILSTILSQAFLILRRIWQNIIINVNRPSRKVPVSLGQILIQLEFSRQIFEIYSNIKLRKQPSSGSRVVPCGRTDTQSNGLTDTQTDIPKIIVAFRNFANAPIDYLTALH
jgi:hypothetical protein